MIRFTVTFQNTSAVEEEMTKQKALSSQQNKTKWNIFMKDSPISSQVHFNSLTQLPHHTT